MRFMHAKNFMHIKEYYKSKNIKNQLQKLAKITSCIYSMGISSKLLLTFINFGQESWVHTFH